MNWNKDIDLFFAALFFLLFSGVVLELVMNLYPSFLTTLAACGGALLTACISKATPVQKIGHDATASAILFYTNKETPPMGKKAKEKALYEILAELEDHQGGNLPDIYPPQTNLRQRERGRQGVIASVIDFFDPMTRLQNQHERERIKVELETSTTLTKVKADTVLDKARVHRETVVAGYKNEAEQWLAVMALKNRGQAIVTQHRDFRDLAEQVLDLGLEPETEKQLIARLYALYFGRNGGGK